MNRKIKKLSIAFAFSLFVFSMNVIANTPAKTFSAQVKTKYSQSEIIDILKKEGYRAEESSKDMIRFKVDGTSFIATNYDNGDVQFVSVYNPDDMYSLRKINKLNQDTRVGKYFLSDGGNLVIEVTLRNAGNGLTKDQIIRGVKDIIFLDKRAAIAFSDK